MNTKELCQHLADTLRDLKAKSIDYRQANSVAAIAHNITRARRLQLDYNWRTPAKPIDGLDS